MKEESGKQALNALIDEAESLRKLLLRVTREIKVLSQGAGVDGFSSECKLNSGGIDNPVYSK